MKQITLTLLIGCISIIAAAQENDAPSATKKKKDIVRLDHGPAIYLTTSTGVNNNTGICGFNFELPLSDKVTIEAGPGVGTWNYKIYAGTKIYLKTAQRGFAFGTGITYATGTRRRSYVATTIYGHEEMTKFNKNPQTNILFAAYKYWNLGRQYNRIYAQLGWSVPLTYGDKITQMSGSPVTDNSIDEIESMAPGGPIAAIGVSFGLY